MKSTIYSFKLKYHYKNQYVLKKIFIENNKILHFNSKYFKYIIKISIYIYIYIHIYIYNLYIYIMKSTKKYLFNKLKYHYKNQYVLKKIFIENNKILHFNSKYC
jgi:hypothetical protein